MVLFFSKYGKILWSYSHKLCKHLTTYFLWPNMKFHALVQNLRIWCLIKRCCDF
jgi:hypothetical protein